MPVARSKLFGYMAGLVCLLLISSAKAEIKFCNDFTHVVYVAMAYPQNNDTWVSRGWLSLKTGECSLFDPALRVKTFYYRAESENFREASGRNVKINWGSGKKFAIWESFNFNYWGAQEKVLNSSLADFTKGPETDGDAVSGTVTFRADGTGSDINIK
jgi:uncharacterized membrane protein